MENISAGFNIEQTVLKISITMDANKKKDI